MNIWVKATDEPFDAARPITATDYVGALRPLLNRYGNDPALSIIVFTLAESPYARELAPLAGVYPALRLSTRGDDGGRLLLSRLRSQRGARLIERDEPASHHRQDEQRRGRGIPVRRGRLPPRRALSGS